MNTYITDKVLADLTPEEQRLLRVYGKNHEKEFDARVHSPQSCPVFMFIDNWLHNFKLKFRESKQWSKRVFDHVKAKHDEEKDGVDAILSPGYHCACEKELGA